jgi:uncharacterized protein (DUF1501 family)
MYIKRRKFIQNGSIASAGLFLPQFLKAWENTSYTAITEKPRVLVILQLSGGNDGLNTVVPVRNDIYYKNRPGLGIKREKTLMLNDEAGVHPNLSVFRSLYDEGMLAVLNEVGYPNPDRSHFRSMDIWHTASKSNEYLNTGWLGRYFDAQCAGCDIPAQILEIDDVLSLALKGQKHKGIAVKSPKQLYQTARQKIFRELSQVNDDTSPTSYLYKTLADTDKTAAYIFEKSEGYKTKLSYPNTELGRGLKTIASLIASDINTSVYYISHGSFDTHVFQEAKQARLFTEINDALAAFIKDLKHTNKMQDVLIMTFSEFGRRVKQNASGGTDHGTANNMFFISGALHQKGIVNALPNLTDLVSDDLQFKVDFRDVYATVLQKWLKADSVSLLNYKGQQLDFL